MFFSENLRHIRLFKLALDSCILFEEYVYLEDIRDITRIDMIPYENTLESNLTKYVVKFGRPTVTNVFEFTYMKIILQILSIKVHEVTETSLINLASKTVIGDYDIMLTGTVAIASTNSLFATNEESYVIWMNNSNFNPFYFLNVFTWQLWISYLISFIICALCCRIMSRTLSRNIFHNFYSLIVNQATDDSIQQSNVSYKIMWFSFLMLLIIFHASFGAFLTAFLAVKLLPFNDLDGLLKQKEYKLCVSDYGLLEPTLQIYPAGRYEIASEINNPDFCPNQVELINYSDSIIECTSNDIVFFGSGDHKNSLISACNLKQLDGKYFKRYRSVMIYSGFRYRSQFNMMILKMKSSGHVDFLYKRIAWYSGIDKTIQPESITPMEFKHSTIILLIFLLGAVCATIIFIIEIGYFKIHQNIRLQNNR